MNEARTDATEATVNTTRRRRFRLAVALVAGLVGLTITLSMWATGDAPAGDPVAALNEGNRLFRNGQLNEAADAYLRGWDPDAVHPTLVYNLGTTLHHLERIPEAILWYRRAGATEDPWLQDNLLLARRTLGSQSLPVGGLDGLLTRWQRGLRLTAFLLSWLALVWALARPAAPVWILVVLALGTVTFWGTAWGHERWGAKPAVLLLDCSTSAGDLPAGTEAWVRPTGTGDWRIAANSADAVCPADAVALVASR